MKNQESMLPTGNGRVIPVWNRAKGAIETEQVYGDLGVRLLYGSSLGFAFANRFMSRRSVSRAAGIYFSSPASRSRIVPFIERYGITMSEFESGPFRSFNDFFARRFALGARTFDPRPEYLPAFAEGRASAFLSEGGHHRALPVKGVGLSIEALLGGPHWARVFGNGPAIVMRLCPTDYHRFHFPDDGVISNQYRVPGKLHSVNPLALRRKPGIHTENERWVSVLETKNFGRLAYIEVGALCVGKIIETHPACMPFKRGDEKGTFLFGASTVILLGEKGAWAPDQDLVEQTALGRETLVRLGESIGACKL